LGGCVIQKLGLALRAAIEATTLETISTGNYDAIVVGAGAAGGLAALLLVEAGAKVLVLDAGHRPALSERPFRRLAAEVVSRAANARVLADLPPPIVNLGLKALKILGRIRQPIQSKCFAWALDPLALVDDRDCPYTVEAGSKFDWFRARQIGGRMTVAGHGCQYNRLQARDFGWTPQARSPWPFPAQDLEPWYDLVEDRLNLQGGPTDPPPEHEREIQERLRRRWPGMTTFSGSFAPPLNALEMAADTARLSCRQGAVVREIDVDANGRVSGVQWSDQQSGRVERATAKVVFLCASALESTRILMLSKNADGATGIGSGSGALGHFLMDHLVVSGEGSGPPTGQERSTYDHRRNIYIPQFDPAPDAAATGDRFSMQIYSRPAANGASRFSAVSFAEMSPRHDSHVRLDPNQTDAWGIPVLRIAAGYSQGELMGAARQSAAIAEVAETLDVKLERLVSSPPPPGSAMHECGTARMGTTPSSSVLDPDNQCWDAQGLYVTDGSAFPAQGLANPTLTIMALTARACAHAISAHLELGPSTVAELEEQPLAAYASAGG